MTIREDEQTIYACSECHGESANIADETPSAKVGFTNSAGNATR
jgi:hypothetical protein